MNIERRRWLRGMLIVVVTAAGCVMGEEHLDDEDDALTDPGEGATGLIVGDVNWINTTRLPADGPEARAARAVGYLALPARGSRCTAWLISARRIVTNQHCVRDAADAVGARVSFNHVSGVKAADRVWYSCPTLVATWSDIDAAVLQCDRTEGVYPGVAQGTLQLADADPPASSAVYVIHQNCDKYTTPGCAPTKKLSRGKVLDAAYAGEQFSYNADTLGGSSGAPVLAASAKGHRVVGLHRAGLNGDAEGRGSSNLARRVSALARRLAEIGM